MLEEDNITAYIENCIYCISLDYVPKNLNNDFQP